MGENFGKVVQGRARSSTCNLAGQVAERLHGADHHQPDHQHKADNLVIEVAKVLRQDLSPCAPSPWTSPTAWCGACL